MKRNVAGGAVLVIVLILGGCQRNDEATATQPATTEADQPISETSATTTTGAVASAALDCKQDFDCFIQASQSCNPAKVIREQTLDLFGPKQTTVSLFEIRGVTDGNRCAFYIRTEKNEIEFPAGTPSEVVSEQKAIAKELEGRDATCKFATDDLTAMLTRWKEGKLSTEDWKVAECEGPYFEPLS